MHIRAWSNKFKKHQTVNYHLLMSTVSSSRKMGHRAYCALAVCLTGMLLAACGGGGGDSGGSGSSGGATIAGLFTVDPSTVSVSSTTTTDPFILPGGPGFTAFGASNYCSTSAGNYTVRETPNAIVYNDTSNSVSASDLDAVARYTEASVRTLRAKFSTPGTIGLDGTHKVRVCARAPAGGGSNGSSGYNDLYVEINNYANKDLVLAQLIKHEMTHMLQAQAMNCQADQYSYERWLVEGMALASAGQDLPTKAEVSTLQTDFPSGQTPFNDINNRTYPDMRRYPAYRLAYDTLLGTSGKTDVDVYNFLKQYAAANGCPALVNNQPPANGWKAAFDAYFAADLRGTGALGTTFWTTAAGYAQ